MFGKWLRSGWALTACGAALVVAVSGCVAYFQRDALIVQWNLRAWLKGDGGGSRLAWLREHRSPVLPAAAAALSSTDPAVCGRAGTLIRVILDDLRVPTDPDAAQLSLVALSRLRDDYPRLIPRARKEAAEAAHLLLQTHLRQWSPHVPTVLDSAGAVFVAALEDADSTVKKSALRHVASLWPAVAVDGSSGPLVREWVLKVYRSAGMLLSDPDPAIREAAAAACSAAPFAEADSRLGELLADDEASVRRAVLLALGESPRPRLQGTQKLLVAPFLGDPDHAVARASERVLTQAGVPRDRLELYRLRYSRDPFERTKAVVAAVHIAQRSGVERVAPFLLELADDEAPAVRLAFLDAAADLPTCGAIVERLRVLAESDPEPSVRARSKDVMVRLRIAVRP